MLSRWTGVRRVLSHIGSGRVLHYAPQRLPCFNPLFRQGATVSLLRHRIARAASSGILTASSIGLALRLILRTRLTPGRLTLPGKPWSFGRGASHPPHRYLYLHLLFQALQSESSHAFSALGMLPYRYYLYPMSSAAGFIPDYYPCPAP